MSMISSIEYKFINGSDHDVANKIITTNDGGFLISGQASSNDGSFNKSGNTINSDIFALKLDTNLNIEWLNKYGGSGHENCFDIIQTIDDGYVLAGITDSNDLDFKKNNTGRSDSIFLLKIDHKGHIQWVEFYGGVGADFCTSVVQTIDKGFLITGGSCSDTLISKFNFFKISSDQKCFLLKVNSLGKYEWEKRFNGDAGEYAASICEATAGDFVLTGGVTGFIGYTFIRKINSYGEILWERKLSGSKASFGNSIIKSSDNSYVFTGYTEDKNGSFSNSNIGKIVIGKIDSSGSIIWLNTYGGGNSESGESIVETPDQGFLVTGNSKSNGGHFQSLNKGNFDAYILKIDKDGTFEWIKNFGGSGIDSGNSITKTSDNCYLITGHSNSTDLDFSNSAPGKMGIFILKITLKRLDIESSQVLTSKSINDKLYRSIEKLDKNQRDIIIRIINDINK